MEVGYRFPEGTDVNWYTDVHKISSSNIEKFHYLKLKIFAILIHIPCFLGENNFILIYANIKSSKVCNPFDLGRKSDSAQNNFNLIQQFLLLSRWRH